MTPEELKNVSERLLNSEDPNAIYRAFAVAISEIISLRSEVDALKAQKKDP